MYEIDARLDARDRTGIAGAILTADPVVVGSPDGGTILSVAVQPQQNVEVGDPVALIQPPPGSLAGPGPLEILAPTQGTIIQLVQVGSTITGADSIVQIYQPNELYFQVAVGFAALTDLRIGMRAHLDHPSIGSVTATLVRVESRMPGSAGETLDEAMLILRPDDPDSLRSIVPGLPFDGFIDIRSGEPDATPALSSFGVGN